METSRRGVYIAGDAAGIEEATSAMLEGELVGLVVANSLGYEVPDLVKEKERILAQLEELRGGETSVRILEGLKKLSPLKIERELKREPRGYTIIVSSS